MGKGAKYAVTGDGLTLGAGTQCNIQTLYQKCARETYVTQCHPNKCNLRGKIEAILRVRMCPGFAPQLCHFRVSCMSHKPAWNPLM